MPTSLTSINHVDIIRFINKITVDKIMGEMLQIAMHLKRQVFYIIILICYIVLQKSIECCKL